MVGHRIPYMIGKDTGASGEHRVLRASALVIGGDRSWACSLLTVQCSLLPQPVEMRLGPFRDQEVQCG